MCVKTGHDVQGKGMSETHGTKNGGNLT